MSDSPAKKAAEQHAADRRADHVRALEEEREGYKRRGLDDRVKQVDAEIARAKKSAPAGRGAAGDKTDA